MHRVTCSSVIRRGHGAQNDRRRSPHRGHEFSISGFYRGRARGRSPMRIGNNGARSRVWNNRGSSGERRSRAINRGMSRRSSSGDHERNRMSPSGERDDQRSNDGRFEREERRGPRERISTASRVGFGQRKPHELRSSIQNGNNRSPGRDRRRYTEHSPRSRSASPAYRSIQSHTDELMDDFRRSTFGGHDVNRSRSRSLSRDNVLHANEMIDPKDDLSSIRKRQRSVSPFELSSKRGMLQSPGLRDNNIDDNVDRYQGLRATSMGGSRLGGIYGSNIPSFDNSYRHSSETEYLPNVGPYESVSESEYHSEDVLLGYNANATQTTNGPAFENAHTQRTMNSTSNASNIGYLFPEPISFTSFEDMTGSRKRELIALILAHLVAMKRNNDLQDVGMKRFKDLLEARGTRFESDTCYQDVVSSRPRCFKVNTDLDTIEPRTHVRICDKYTRNVNIKDCKCRSLRMCKFFLVGTCVSGDDCKFKHDLSTHHNSKVLKRHCLQRMDNGCIKALISNFRNRNSTTSPTVCKFYNNEGGCKQAGRCQHLHVCLHFVRGDCKFGRRCKRDHHFDGMQSRNLLYKYGLIEYRRENRYRDLFKLIRKNLKNGTIRTRGNSRNPLTRLNTARYWLQASATVAANTSSDALSGSDDDGDDIEIAAEYLPLDTSPKHKEIKLEPVTIKQEKKSNDAYQMSNGDGADLHTLDTRIDIKKEVIGTETIANKQHVSPAVEINNESVTNELNTPDTTDDCEMSGVGIEKARDVSRINGSTDSHTVIIEVKTEPESKTDDCVHGIVVESHEKQDLEKITAGTSVKSSGKVHDIAIKSPEYSEEIIYRRNGVLWDETDKPNVTEIPPVSVTEMPTASVTEIPPASVTGMPSASVGDDIPAVVNNTENGVTFTQPPIVGGHHGSVQVTVGDRSFNLVLKETSLDVEYQGEILKLDEDLTKTMTRATLNMLEILNEVVKQWFVDQGEKIEDDSTKPEK